MIRSQKRLIFSYALKVRFGCRIFFNPKKSNVYKWLKCVICLSTILLFMSGFYKFNFSIKFSTKRRVWYNLNFYENLLNRARLMNTKYEDYYSNTNDTVNDSNDKISNDTEEDYDSSRLSTEFQLILLKKNTKCPEKSPYLKGKSPVVHPHHVNYITQNMTKFWYEILAENTDVQTGGWYKPPNCVPANRVAIIIPYRNRSKHLAVLLQQLNKILKRQLIQYQNGNETFNKARLMNTAFETIHKNRFKNQFNCFVFHDVDLLPENDRNLYVCSNTTVFHLSPAVDSLRYVLPYPELVGGVLAITPEQFQRVNGYSNLYWGWGGEDDDMHHRLSQENITVSRSPMNIGRYKMLRHPKRMTPEDVTRYHLLWSAKERYKRDGLAQLHSFNCTLISLKFYALYTHLLVDVGGTPDSSLSLLPDK